MINAKEKCFCILPNCPCLYLPAHKVTLQTSDAWCRILKCTRLSPLAQCAGGSSPECSPATKTGQKQMMLLLFRDPDRHLLEQTRCRNTDILKSELASILAPHLILFSYKILMLQGRNARFSGTTQSPCLTKCEQNSAVPMHSMLKAYGKRSVWN